MESDLVSVNIPTCDERIFLTESYDYYLPRHLIAQEGRPVRDSSRLMVLCRRTGRIEHTWFRSIPDYLEEGAVLVVNNSKVLPARLFGRKETGGKVELLLVAPCASWEGPLERPTIEAFEEKEWWCLVRASGRLRKEGGCRLWLEGGIEATLHERNEEGLWRITLHTEEPVLKLLDRIGHPPLPPYIKRPRPGQSLMSSIDDAARYQTIFAQEPGSIAAPTAGLHFTEQLCEQLKERGIRIVEITLHVGVATFRPIRTHDVRYHRLPPERYTIPEDTAREIEQARREGRCVVGVGTTVVRCLESAAATCGEIRPHKGWATAYILPGYAFRVVRAMITNFHLPKTSLLVLIAAFAGKDRVLHAYQEAVQHGYRFYSYGDAMLIHECTVR